jgi:hypothetical protein
MLPYDVVDAGDGAVAFNIPGRHRNGSAELLSPQQVRSAERLAGGSLSHSTLHPVNGWRRVCVSPGGFVRPPPPQARSGVLQLLGGRDGS